jgi:hypothetical protein
MDAMNIGSWMSEFIAFSGGVFIELYKTHGVCVG